MLWEVPEYADTATTPKETAVATTPAATTPATTATTQTTQTPSTATEEAETPLIYDLVKRKVDEVEATQTRANELLDAYKTAQANGDSAISALLKSAEPKRKENEEKRLRNIAKVQAFGDMLSAAARGVFAYNKKGMGYVPKVDLNSPLKNIEKLNEMRDLYLKEKKAWDADMLKFNIEREADKEAAAKALATAAQERADDAQKGLDELLLASIKMDDAWKRHKDAEDRADKRAKDANNTRRYIASLQGSGSDNDEDENIAERMYNRLHPWKPRPIKTTEEINGPDGMKTVERTTESKYADDQKQRQLDAETNGIVNTALVLYNDGLTEEEALLTAVSISLMDRGFSETYIEKVIDGMQKGQSYEKAIENAVRGNLL